MRNPLFKKNYLFVRDGCPYCAIAKKSVNQINMKLPINNQIKIVDCTYYDKYGIITDPIIKIFQPYLESYPTLFMKGAKKEGANSVIEYVAMLKVKLFGKFMLPSFNEYLPNIDKYAMFDLECKMKGGRVICS